MFGPNRNTNDGRMLYFRQPFNERYTLTVKADVLAGTMPVKTVTEIRWDLRVKKVTNEEAEIEILTLDNNLLETNNPSLKDLARMNQAFAKMYSELDLVISRKGIVKQIKNIDLIRKKWTNTKAEMESIDKHSDAIKGIVNLNDEIFNTPQKMQQAVQNNEFFSVYFHHIYGRALPAETELFNQWNLFQMAEVQWQYSIRPSQPLPADASLIQVNITGNVTNRLNGEWIKKAYGAFQNIDNRQLTPRLSELGKYSVEPASGKLVEAYLLKEEVAHPQFLFSKLEYIFKSSVADNANGSLVQSVRAKTQDQAF